MELSRGPVQSQANARHACVSFCFLKTLTDLGPHLCIQLGLVTGCSGAEALDIFGSTPRSRLEPGQAPHFAMRQLVGHKGACPNG